MDKIELLAPAGSLETLKLAIMNGADAVYVGGKHFGARAFANNFNHEELKEAVAFAHLYGVRLYVTMNTLLNEFELEQAMKEVAFLYSIRVDALIIQDLGLYARIMEEFPDFEIHASTQMHIHNLKGVETAKALGFRRVVLARESSLPLIKEACKKGIEIEVFVHGAICVSYSGQCLMSSKMKGRSGNKGVCAQCCRLPYELIDLNSGEKIKTRDRYLLSPKDMNLLSHIPSLIEAGVTSLKIEGRMKKKEYVAYITRLYRKAIDAYYEGREFIISEEMDRTMRSLFHRDFTDAYLMQKDEINFFQQDRPNHQGTPLGEIIKKERNRVSIKLSDDIHQFDGIRVLNQRDEGMMINFLYQNGKLVSEAKKGDIIELDLNFETHVKDKAVKTSDYLLEQELGAFSSVQRLPLQISVVGKVKEPLRLLVKYQDIELELKSSSILEPARTKAVDQDKIVEQLSKLKETPYFIERIVFDLDEIFLPLKEINELRRNMVEQLNQKREEAFQRNPGKPNCLKKEVVDAPYRNIFENKIPDKEESVYLSKEEDESSYYLTDVINTDSNYPNAGRIAVSEMGGLFLNAPHKIAYYTLNVSNSYAYAFLKSLGFEAVMLSSELSLKEVDALFEAYQKRGGKDIPFLLQRGKRDLMYLQKNPLFFLRGENSSLALKYQEELYSVKKSGKITILQEEEEKVMEENSYRSFYRF